MQLIQNTGRQNNVPAEKRTLFVKNRFCINLQIMLSHIGKLNHFYATALSFYFARYATAERAATFPSPAAFTYWYGAPVKIGRAHV